MKKFLSFSLIMFLIMALSGCNLLNVNNQEEEIPDIRYMSSINLALATIDKFESTAMSDDEDRYYFSKITQSEYVEGVGFSQSETEGIIDVAMYKYGNGDELFMHTDNTINAGYKKNIENDNSQVYLTRLPEGIYDLSDSSIIFNNLNLAWEVQTEYDMENYEKNISLISFHNLEFYQSLAESTFSVNNYSEETETSKISISVTTQSAKEYFYNNLFTNWGRSLSINDFELNDATIELEVNRQLEVVELSIAVDYSMGENFEDRKLFEVLTQPAFGSDTMIARPAIDYDITIEESITNVGHTSVEYLPSSQSVNLSVDITRGGYGFVGWYDRGNLLSENEDYQFVISSNIDIMAVYEYQLFFISTSGVQISADPINSSWKSSVSPSSFNTASGASQEGNRVVIDDGFELISTTSETIDENGAGEFDFYAANYDTDEFTIVENTESYLVFDLYLLNQGASDLQLELLDTSSIIDGIEDRDSACVTRVGFVVEGSAATEAAAVNLNGGTSQDTYIWEPNSEFRSTAAIMNNAVVGSKYDYYGVNGDNNGNVLSEEALDEYSHFASDPNFNSLVDYTYDVGAGDSGIITTLQSGKITKIKVFIWIEAQDIDSYNSIGDILIDIELNATVIAD
jgi:hypothetical protein